MGIGLLMALAVGQRADAAVEPIDIQGLELASGGVMDRPPVVAWGKAGRVRGAAVDQMRRDEGNVWLDWDPARQHVGGIITTGLSAPGSVGSPARAQDYAVAWLGRYVEMLAPGASIDDFVVVSNDLSNGIRTVGLAQYSGGLPVRGGQMSVRFKADRMVYVASQAMPWVDVNPHTGALVDPTLAFTRAQDWIEDDYPGILLSAMDFEGPFILPIWNGSAWTYHEVVSVRVEASNRLAQWSVFVDAATGDVVAREQLMHSAGTIEFNVPVRQPLSTRYDAIATQLSVSEPGAGNSVTDLNGEVNLASNPTTINTTVTGPIVNVENDSGPEAQNSFPINDPGTVTWNDSGNQFVDAQLSAFVHTSLVKNYVRNLDPGLGWLDGQIDVTVNIDGSCNASSNGNDIFFLQSSGMCQNTARLADVVYHEVGHSVHRQSIIEGVGAFEGALSEGISDYLAATIVNDSGMGRGFFNDNQPLRELNPDGSEWTWPEDKGAVHAEGRIIGGTLWDLRTALMGTLGDEAGRHHTDMIYYEGHRRAVNIPTMYPEALVYDDDDGDLSNGTPNICEINEVFENHGLLDLSEIGGFTVDFAQAFEGGRVSVNSSLPVLAGCPIELGDATLRWRFRGDNTSGDEIPMSLEDGSFVADIPTQDTGVVVEYQVTLTYSNGDEQQFPQNAADPWYQGFFGAADPIYCLDDNADTNEWIFSGGDNFWTFDPLGTAGIDPGEPWDDDGVLMHQEGSYTPNDDTLATGPAIDISGYTDVRLHYRRWLTVEDAFYDQATIYANGQPEWENLSTNLTNVHHIDREWRFHDVPLNDHLGGDVTIAFGLDSDQGLHFGGWTIDGMCVVEVVEAICGDGQVTGDEECDDGNTDDGDGCDASCVTEEVEPPGTTGGEDETGGDETGDDDDSGGGSGAGDNGNTSGPPAGTSGADGSTGGDDAGADGGVSDDGGCGCVAGSSDEPLRGGAWLLLLAAGALRRRRR